MPNGLRDDPRIFVAIAEDGTVTVTCHRSEMGQGVRTSWPMVVADELDADWAQDQGRAGLGRRAAFRQPGYRRLAQHAASLRGRCAASAPRRARCSKRPRQRSGVCRSARSRRTNHEVVHAASSRRARLRRAGEGRGRAAGAGAAPRSGSRTRRSSAISASADIRLVDNMDITTGKAVFGIDPRLPDMFHAVVARPPVSAARSRASTRPRR